MDSKWGPHAYPKPCLRMFRAALFIMALNWKWPKCSSTTDGYVNCNRQTTDRDDRRYRLE